MKEVMKRYYVGIVFLLSACSSTGVVPMDKDTYMVSKRSAQVGFGPANGAKADLYDEAIEPPRLSWRPFGLSQAIVSA